MILVAVLLALTVNSCYGAEDGKFEEVAKDIKAIELKNGKLGMVAYMLTGENEKEDKWRTTLRRMRKMGVQVVELGQIAWEKMEPAPGKYNWTYTDTVLRINKEEDLGLEFVADIGMFINPHLNGVPKLPKYLEGLEYDDAKVILSLSNLYREFLKLPGADKVKYVFQHFENADASLKGRAEDRPRVQKLLKESFKAIKEVRPDIKTGVCIQSYKKPHWPEQMIKQWNLEIDTDVVPIISFSPNHFRLEHDSSETLEEFERVAKLAKGKPIALNEWWFHSSSHGKSSNEKQSEFVRQVFALLKKHHQKIEFATWYEYSDIDPFRANIIGVYLAAVTGNPMMALWFNNVMGSCGLFTHKDKLKPAGKTWCNEASSYYKFRTP